MKIVDAVKSVFRNYATFTGRARRAEYWNYVVFNIVVSGILGALVELGTFFGVLLSIYNIAVLIPGLAVFWRRMHDIGRSGTNILWVLLPLVGWIILIVRLARPGTAGANQYGPDPKAETKTGKDDGGTPPWEY